MQTPISLKTAERKAFQTTFADGLWDVLIGSFALMFAIAPLLSASLGDFWSSAIFLPFWGAVYLAIWLARKYMVAPRIGTVSFARPRREKIARFTMLMLIVNSLAAVLGIIVVVLINQRAGTEAVRPLGLVIQFILGLFLLVGFSLSAYLLEYARLYFYGLLLFAAPFGGEWLSVNYGAAHHGYPITFGIAAAVIVVVGVLTFLRLLRDNPPLDLLNEKASSYE
jgi:hypothetical protein